MVILTRTPTAASIRAMSLDQTLDETMPAALARASEEIGQLRAKLKLAEMRLADAQRMAPLGYWERDLVIGSAWWSDELRRILGVPADAPVPTLEMALERVHADDRGRLRQAYKNAADAGTPIDTEYRLVRDDGAERVVHGRVEASVGRDGAPIRLKGTVQDITERRLLEQALLESEARCKSVFENVPVGVVVVGPDRRYSMTNPAWTRMTGYSAEELTRLDVFEVTHPEERAESERILAGTRAGHADVFALDKRFVRKNGELFWGRVAGTVVRDERGQIRCWVGIIEDITEKKQGDIRRAERQSAQRAALVREVHHRIKNSIQGVAGLLERHAVSQSALEPLIAEAVAQLNVLATVHGLQGARAEGGLNLCDVARGVVDTQRAVSPVALGADECVPVALVLNELVSNAVKHADRSVGRPAVNVDIARQGAQAWVSVRSEPAFLPPGFDLESGRFTGTGLRLCKSLLPGEGASLAVGAPSPGVVVSVLTLSPPVLNGAHAGEGGTSPRAAEGGASPREVAGADDR